MNHLSRICIFLLTVQTCASERAEARVVFPTLTDSSGHTLQEDDAFVRPLPRGTGGDGRRRRSLPHETQSGRDEDGDELYVSIHDNGEEILLELTPNTKLVSPMTVIEWFYEDGRHVVRRMQENCFYSGRDVRAKGHSLVAVSNCDGLVGYIQTNNESYFIEPLTDELRRTLLQGGDEPDFGEDEGARSRFQEQRERISRFEELQRLDTPQGRGARPHVIYKVKSVLDKLNLSVDQDFEIPSVGEAPSWNPPGKGSRNSVSPKGPPKGFPRRGKARSRRSLEADAETRFLKGGRRTYPHKRNSDGGGGGGRGRMEEKKNKRRNNKGGKRKKRNNCRRVSSREREAASNRSLPEDEREGESPEGERCLTKRERRERRKELREKRRAEREKRRRQREERRREKERKKKRKKNKKQKHNRGRQHSTLVDPLEYEEWKGYSPDVLWETQIAPGQSGLTEIEFGAALNESDPAKWLEITVGVDYTVIDFHGEDNVEKYIFTLFNIVSAIYEDPSLQANLDIVLLRLIFYNDKNQSRVKEGLARRSLEAVNRWAETLSRLSTPSLRHDLAVWLTRLDLGGPSGYAPVAGVCDPTRSCTLNRDEGLTSAFIIAHEMGHVLGMSHDGEETADNSCEAEGRLGSVMAPLVAATFGRFHWSRCSKEEYHSFSRSWECLLNEPEWEKATLMAPSIQFQYSLDDQCRMEFGEGFNLCRTFGMSDPCTFLWCSNFSTPHLCKTKKGPPLEGTLCGDNMWCRHGFCEPIRDSDLPEENDGITPDNKTPIRHNPQHGGWSSWSTWGSCSRTCGTGVMFRTRSCDNPVPRWGGRLCPGKREEWKVCSTTPCKHLSDLRADQCRSLSHLVKLGRRRSKLKWLPYESKRKRKKCRITCVSHATNEVYMGKEYLVDGTHCSYDDPYSICVQGKCVPLGCDNVVGSNAKLDDCGVCGGNGSECRRNTFYFTDAPLKDYVEVATIPEGAWKIAVGESPSTANFLSLRNSLGELVLNPLKRQEPERDFICEGSLFHYVRRANRESLLASGPLVAPVTVMVHGGVVREEVTVTVSYLMREDPRDVFRWGVGPLTTCSASCGGGSQSESVRCQDLKLSKWVEDEHCSHMKPPQPKTFPCNQFGCLVRWVASPWEHCSATCGVQGKQYRQVSCMSVNLQVDSTISPQNVSLRSSLHELNTHFMLLNTQQESLLTNPIETEEEEEEVATVMEAAEGKIKDRQYYSQENNFNGGVSLDKNILENSGFEYVDPLFCRNEEEPPSQRPCNRILCPGYWELQGWTECSVTCGMGEQEAIFVCDGENDVETYANNKCGKKPRELRACFAGKCNHTTTEQMEKCNKDESTFCQLPTLHRYCEIPKYYQLCCYTCSQILD